MHVATYAPHLNPQIDGCSSSFLPSCTWFRFDHCWICYYRESIYYSSVSWSLKCLPMQLQNRSAKLVTTSACVYVVRVYQSRANLRLDRASPSNQAAKPISTIAIRYYCIGIYRACVSHMGISCVACYGKHIVRIYSIGK